MYEKHREALSQRIPSYIQQCFLYIQMTKNAVTNELWQIETLLILFYDFPPHSRCANMFPTFLITIFYD